MFNEQVVMKLINFYSYVKIKLYHTDENCSKGIIVSKLRGVKHQYSERVPSEVWCQITQWWIVLNSTNYDVTNCLDRVHIFLELFEQFKRNLANLRSSITSIKQCQERFSA